MMQYNKMVIKLNYRTETSLTNTMAPGIKLRKIFFIILSRNHKWTSHKQGKEIWGYIYTGEKENGPVKIDHRYIVN